MCFVHTVGRGEVGRSCVRPDAAGADNSVLLPCNAVFKSEVQHCGGVIVCGVGKLWNVTTCCASTLNTENRSHLHSRGIGVTPPTPAPPGKNIPKIPPPPPIFPPPPTVCWTLNPRPGSDAPARRANRSDQSLHQPTSTFGSVAHGRNRGAAGQEPPSLRAR